MLARNPAAGTLNRLLVGCLVLAFAASIGRGAVTQPATDSPKTLALPSFGVSVPVPDGFERDTDDDVSIVMLVPRGQAGKTPDRALMVLARPQGKMSLEEIIPHLTKAESVRVKDAKADWNGQPAVELDRDDANPDPKLMPARMLVIAKDGIIYQLIYSATPEHRAELDAYNAVKKQIVFSKPTPAAQAIATRMPRLTGPNGIPLPIPDPFRPDMQNRPGHITMWLARDFAQKKFAAKLLVVPLDPDPARNSLAAAKQEVVKQLGPVMKLPADQIVWTDTPGPAGNLAQSSSARLAVPNGFARLLLFWRPDGAATVFCLSYSGEGEELTKLEQTIEVIQRGL